MTYNAPGSRIYSQAKNLSEYFESNCKGLFKNVEDVDKPANAVWNGFWISSIQITRAYGQGMDVIELPLWIYYRSIVMYLPYVVSRD